MTITRYVDVVNTEKYQLDVDESFVHNLNEYITQSCTGPFKAVTLDEVIACWKRDDSFTRYEEVLDFSRNWHPTLGAVINWYIDDEIWNNYVETIDSEYGPHDDEVSD